MTTLAVIHPGRHEETIEVLGFASRTDPCDHALVVVDAVLSGDLLVVPAVILNKLAAALPEREQIRVVGRELPQRRVDRVGFREVLVEIERSVVPRGITMDDVLVVTLGNDERLRKLCPPELAADW